MWNSNYADGFTRYEMKLGLSHSGKNTGWGCSRIGCWGSYWDIREKRELRIGEDSIRRSYITCTPRQILFIDHIKKNARDGEFNTYRGEGSCIQGCGGEHRDGDHLEDIRVNVRIILKMILKKRIGGSGLDWCGWRLGQVAVYCENGYASWV